MTRYRRFAERHIGPNEQERATMLGLIGYNSLNGLIDAAIPEAIRFHGVLDLPDAVTEEEALSQLRGMAANNVVLRSCIGQGYYGTYTPSVILNNVLGNPEIFTAYTAYAAEISQGRLGWLLNYQTMVVSLTGMEIANASTLDEGTSTAEAMKACHTIVNKKQKRAPRQVFFVSEACHPQTVAVVETRAKPLGIRVVIGDHRDYTPDQQCFGVLVQYPDTTGDIHDFREFFDRAHHAGALCIVATDLLSLTLLTPPGEFGADFAVGSTQRFGVPMGFGGPHAGFFATREDYIRQMPGRLVGVSKDAQENPAVRLMLGPREQHIAREKATSNICTAQVLLAVMASLYAVYHGPQGLRQIAERVHALTMLLAEGLRSVGARINSEPVFDTLSVTGINAPAVHAAAKKAGFNFRHIDNTTVGISLDETTTLDDVWMILQIFNPSVVSELQQRYPTIDFLTNSNYSSTFGRTSRYLEQAIFNSYHTETKLLRYIKRMARKDYSLVHGMIGLGSCTMKLNSASSLMPLMWPEFANMHPFAPLEQAKGYLQLFADLERWLAEITGFAGVSLQPNAGSQGELAGLFAIRAYHESRGESHRKICLIPSSAHGTNPASAAMCGMRVVEVLCDSDGNIDITDLRAKAQEHSANLACLMVTYPSTHGVFEEGIREICQIINFYGGQVYLDGANMNAMVGLCRPGKIGAAVMHLNLHKTFSIPHGGGGPGMGPICVAAHLAPFLPTHPALPTDTTHEFAVGPVSAAPYGSALILTIPWMYIRMMGSHGLREATEVAILSANYIAARINPYFRVVFRGKSGLVAHECIFDMADDSGSGVTADQIANRLKDYGLHPPTIHFPRKNGFMVEPTESEDLTEVDRFCEAMISIHLEREMVRTGWFDLKDNPFSNAPHTQAMVLNSQWEHLYTREIAAFPVPGLRDDKQWPDVALVDAAFGDRNPVCTCGTVEDYAENVS